MKHGREELETWGREAPEPASQIAFTPDHHGKHRGPRDKLSGLA